MSTRYWIALAVALALVACGATFCLQTRREVVASMREALAGVVRTPENAEALADAERNLAAGEALQDFGMEVPPSLLWRIQLADLFRTFWPAWIAFVLGICFGVAWLLRSQPPVQSP